ncbi:MAG: N-6 DNA methylase, partial [Saprospiraceae bacterium]
MSRILVDKLWSFCDTLRDDGVSYGDYVEQLTFLLFLKMVEQYNSPLYDRQIALPEHLNWNSFRGKAGAALEDHYNMVLRELARQPGMLGAIFTKAQNKITDPAKLLRLWRLIDDEDWAGMDVRDKGDIYEGLLQKNAEDVKSGAGQYFTPRPLIEAIVDCVEPRLGKTIADPACGTGGFFLSAHEFLKAQNPDRAQTRFLKLNTFHGWEIVANTTRLCLMNLILHGIGDVDSEPTILRNDSLLEKPAQLFDYVLTNPPFGKKSSFKVSTDEEGEAERETQTYNRQDFWTTTSNKQLNFLQHIVSILKTDGQAAVVLPDNVLFEGGAGEVIRRRLMEKCDLHTILRLPTGIFYAQGVKANVLFFDAKPASPKAWTRDVWIYDYRTNITHTLKTNPLKRPDLDDFVKNYCPGRRHERRETWSAENPEGRWRKFDYSEILQRDKTNLDIFWLKDNSLTDYDNLPAPDALLLGCVTQSGTQGGHIALVAKLHAGLPHETIAHSINNYCASGLSAIGQAIAKVASGEMNSILAGGVES